MSSSGSGTIILKGLLSFSVKHQRRKTLSSTGTCDCIIGSIGRLSTDYRSTVSRLDDRQSTNYRPKIGRASVVQVLTLDQQSVTVSRGLLTVGRQSINKIRLIPLSSVDRQAIDRRSTLIVINDCRPTIDQLSGASRPRKCHKKNASFKLFATRKNPLCISRLKSI